MRQRKKQLLTFLLLAAAILAFCLLWQPRAVGGVEISTTVEVKLPDYIDQADIEAKTKVGKFWIGLLAEAYEKGLRANGCYSSRVNFRLKEEGVLILRLSCADCQPEGGNFHCPRQIQEEVTKK